MNFRHAGARLRRLVPIAIAAAIGVGAGAGAYAFSNSGSGTTTTTRVVVPAQPASSTSTSSDSLTQLYKQDAPGVVDITVTSTTSTGSSGSNPFNIPGAPQQKQKEQAEGTGFVIDTKGDIMTAQHVVNGANSITVHFQDGSSAKATLVGNPDKTTDTAVIHVNVPASKLHPLTLGNSAAVQPGQSVVAIGSPFGLPGTMTAGIVSATQRTISATNGFSITGAIQTDASINHGNSGGPLIDAATNTVIGINDQIESDTNDNAGIGFAVPINAAKNVAQTVISGGTVQHAYVGVRIEDAPNGGARITHVVAGTPAAKAGLKVGDVITAFNGQAVTSADEVTADVSKAKPNETVTLTIQRNGATKQVSVTLGVQPASLSS